MLGFCACQHERGHGDCGTWGLDSCRDVRVPENGLVGQLPTLRHEPDALALRLFEAVQRAALGFDAVVTRAGFTVSLEDGPQGDAAPVMFSVDTPQQVTCLPGTHGMTFRALA